MNILPPALMNYIPNGKPMTGKYRIALVGCGNSTKPNSKVGTQGNKEKNRRIQQLCNQGIKVLERE